MKIYKILAVFLPFYVCATAAAAYPVHVSWHHAHDEELMRYRVYASVTSGGQAIGFDYLLEVDAGLNSATVEVPDEMGRDVYLVVTAVDVGGLESSPSNELHRTPYTPGGEAGGCFLGEMNYTL